MTGILNAIMAIGGTTAHQSPKTAADVLTDCSDGPDVLAAVVAEDHGHLIGWQSAEVWQGGAHIGTFVQPGIQATGVGAALFAMTRVMLTKADVPAIVASIRAANTPGLAHYASAGFVEFAQDADFTLNDGRVVGRVHRRFPLV